MFTGIVEERGNVVALDHLGDAVRLTVSGAMVTSDAEPGASISVNGCCLTVVTHGDGSFTADVTAESLDRTALGALVPGSEVNLERAVPVTGRLGGHLVQGHVDGTSTLLERRPSQHWELLVFALPEQLARYLASKGSIAVDGVSLTVVDLTAATDGQPATFTVSLVPTTLRATTLGGLAPGDQVNLEVDVVAKYVERLLATGSLPPAATGGAA